MADITKMVTKFANSSAGHQLASQVARDPQKALAGTVTAVAAVGPVLAEVAIVAAPIAVAGALGYGLYRFGKWIFE